MIIDFYNRGNGGGGTGTTYNSITETTTNTTISNSTIDLNGDVKVNGEPIVVPDMDNYFTKDESDARYELKPFDPATGATSPNFVYLTFNDGSEPRYDYFTNGVIPVFAYQNVTNIESVWVGDGITEDQGNSFRECYGITNVRLGSMMHNVGMNSFTDNSNLTSIELGSAVTLIDGGAFSNTAISEITLPSTVESIGDWSFNSCNNLSTIKSYALTAPAIGEGAFQKSFGQQTGTVYYPAGADYSTWMEHSVLSCWAFVEMEATLEERVEANENSIDSLDERVTALEEGGGGGIPQALHYESDEIEDGDTTYKETLDINKDDSIAFRRSDDPDGWKGTFVGRGALTFSDADDYEGTNGRTVGLNPYGIEIVYDEPEMPATHISYGSVEVTNAEVKMTMSTDEGFMGAVTIDADSGDYNRGVMMMPDGVLQAFNGDDYETLNSFIVNTSDEHTTVTIDNEEQPIMKVLTKAEYEALTDKKDYILYIIKG